MMSDGDLSVSLYQMRICIRFDSGYVNRHTARYDDVPTYHLMIFDGNT